MSRDRLTILKFGGSVLTSPDTGRGGAMYNYSGSSPSLLDCALTNNTAETWGGALCNEGYSYPTLSVCTVSGNLAAISGGGIYSTLSSSWLDSTVFCENAPEYLFGAWVDVSDLLDVIANWGAC